MSNPYRDCLVELYAWAKRTSSHYYRTADVIDRTRILLTQPEPAELTDDKLMDIACATDLVYCMGKGYGFASRYMEEADITAEVLAFARAVLARYSRPTIEPVPVSERPWEREGWCDAEGQCWWFRPADFDEDDPALAWYLDGSPAPKTCWKIHFYGYTHSLPANALPTPEALDD